MGLLHAAAARAGLPPPDTYVGFGALNSTYIFARGIAYSKSLERRLRTEICDRHVQKSVDIIQLV